MRVKAKSPSRRRGEVINLMVKRPKPVNKRGQGFALVNQPTTVDADGKRRPGTFGFEAIKPIVTNRPSEASPIPAAASSEIKVKQKRYKKKRIEDKPIPLEQIKWLTIAQTALRYPAFSEKSLRHLQTQAENYQNYPKAGLKSTGFIDCILRPAGQRKILIDAEKFEQWLRNSAVSGKK